MAQKSLNVVLTGGARGIGRGLCRLLLSKGHSVFVVDSNKSELSAIEGLYRTQHPNTLRCLLADLRKPDHIKDISEQARAHFDGYLDLLINNAARTGGVGEAPFAKLSLETWTASVETNLTAPFLLSQACLPMLQKGTSRSEGGAIVHISSTRAHQSEPDSEGYAATKAGLIGLTHAMAVSLAPQGISVNAILPGWIDVSNECSRADEEGDTWGKDLTPEDHAWHPAGRVGKVEDIFDAVEYLARAKFVTGTEMVIDGGVTRKMVYPE
ncbi:MAG: hypothetical protein M1828_000486 [Chrysothrix sp. TS-e1954]|nr:MAG: hypothetical protein M1828_000486 [Chrysothrix sp. TS-e1954]